MYCSGARLQISTSWGGWLQAFEKSQRLRSAEVFAYRQRISLICATRWIMEGYNMIQPSTTCCWFSNSGQNQLMIITVGRLSDCLQDINTSQVVFSPEFLNHGPRRCLQLKQRRGFFASFGQVISKIPVYLKHIFLGGLSKNPICNAM